jgi:transcriptional regulator with XRE-family HTH domain
VSNHLGEYIRARREELGLRRSEVARQLGYENVNKGSARLHSVEEGRWVNRDFLVRLIGVLNIEPQVIQDLIDRDRQAYMAAWEAWADQPTPITAAIRLIPGFIASIDLPENVTTPDQALAWAVETAIRRRMKVFVVVSRRLSYTVHENGRVDDIHATLDSNGLPWMALGSSRFLVNLGGGNGNESEGRTTR